jgi:hypothetical protein
MASCSAGIVKDLHLLVVFGGFGCILQLVMVVRHTIGGGLIRLLLGLGAPAQ